MKVNGATYDTNISVEVSDFDLSLKMQYVQGQDDLKLDILSFFEEFKLIKVTIPDQKLQEIWDLVMNTHMMQDFLIEDILHHYFIKMLPQIDLTNLATVPINGKSFVIKVLDIPGVEEQDPHKFITFSLGIEEASSAKGIRFRSLGHFTEALAGVKREMTILQANKIADQGTEDDQVPDMQIDASASLLSMIGTNMLGDINIDLASIDAIKSQLTLKNLRLVFPDLQSYYTDDDDLVNLDLAVNIQSERRLWASNSRQRQRAGGLHARPTGFPRQHYSPENPGQRSVGGALQFRHREHPGALLLPAPGFRPLLDQLPLRLVPARHNRALDHH